MSSYLATAIIAYLVGSIPTGYLWGKARGVDIRQLGSGNIGATNVFRFLGKTAGITVLLIDALKGFLPTKFLTLGAPPELREYYAMAAGFFAIIGHNYTCWLRFRGGKGIATSAGVLAALTPLAFGIALTVWLLVFAFSRYVSLASILAAVALPIAVGATQQSGRMILLTSVLSALAIVKHKSNIQRLLAGKEHRFGAKREAGQ